MRISGMGSGFDVGGTIEQILEIERRKVERIQEQQVKKDDRIGAWIDVKESLTSFTRAADTLRWMDVWRTMATPSSNPEVITATARSTAAQGTYAIEVSQMAHAHTIASASNLETAGGDPVKSDTLLSEITGIEVGDEFVIGGQSFTVTGDDTLRTLRDKINAAADDMPDDERVRATILDHRLVLQREKTGADTITANDAVGSTLQLLGITDGVGNPANELLEAQNAVFSVNNAIIERESNTGIDDVLEGVTFHLQGVGTSTLTVGPDTEAIKDAIRNFVDTYNEAAEKMKLYGSTDMTDPAIPVPGLLQEDSLLREINFKLRSQLTQNLSGTHTAENAGYTYNGLEGVMDALHHIGIWTTGEDNRLEIVDEARLDEMLSQNIEKVEQLFRGVQTESGQRENGIALNLYRTSRDYTSELDGWIDVRIERIDDNIQQLDARIERILKDIEAKEQMLWRQFGAMDEAIGRMQAGFEYLMGQIGSPGG